jgi:argininosuccinate synthase
MHIRPGVSRGLLRDDASAGARQRIDREQILRKLVEIQYERNDHEFTRGVFRVRGDIVEVYTSYDDSAVRIELFGDEVDELMTFDALTGKTLKRHDKVAIYPKTHFVTPRERTKRAVESIKAELEWYRTTLESEGKVLEDPAQEVPDYVYSRTDDPEKAPDRPTYITVGFEKGDASALDGKPMAPAALLEALNALGRQNGIGRLDLVENRFVGMKSRGMYETPGGTILIAAHRGIESITLDRGAAHLKDELMPRYAELIYDGFWFAPEREMLQAAIDKSQEFVTGTVRLKLYKGNVAVVGRASPYSLYDQDLVTFEEGKVAYDHRDAEGFIRLNALRLRTLGRRRKKLKN